MWSSLCTSSLLKIHKGQGVFRLSVKCKGWRSAFLMCCKHVSLLLLSASSPPWQLPAALPATLEFSIPLSQTCNTTPSHRVSPLEPLLSLDSWISASTYSFGWRAQKLHSTLRGKGSDPQGNTVFSLCLFLMRIP